MFPLDRSIAFVQSPLEQFHNLTDNADTLSGFSNIQVVANLHAVGRKPIKVVMPKINTLFCMLF